MEAIRSWEEAPFAYGESDCCQFVSYVYERAIGRELLVPAYRGKTEAMQLLAQYGSLAEAASSAVQRCHVEPQFLRPGDLALFVNNGREALGIVLPVRVVVTVHHCDGTLHFAPWTGVRCGWRMAGDDD